MTAPPRPSAIPATQNTAPVAEFRCLFTHDIRRKQKRWQDGYLKFHAFNSRVIVYDTSRFTVGETYYKDSDELQEGDELTLDKGVLVEIAEAIGVTQTDLTPLFGQKTKDPPRHNSAIAPQTPRARPAIPASNPLRAASHLRHRSLNTLLGTPKGPIGKSVPIRPPFEERNGKENHHVEERANKRQKVAHEPRVQLAPSSVAAKENVPKKAPPVFAQPLHANNTRVPLRPQVVPRGATVISLSSDPANVTSDLTLPSTPPGMPRIDHLTNGTSAPTENQSLPQQSTIHATPKLPKGKVPVPHVKAQQTPQPRPQPSSPPVSASNRLANVDFAIQPVSDPPREPSPGPLPAQLPQPLQNRKTKSLRLSTGVKRGMLLCQSVPPQRPTTSYEPKARVAPIDAAKGAQLQDKDHHSHRNDDEITQKGAAEARNTTANGKRRVQNEPTTMEPEKSPQPSLGDLEEMEFMHGLMDEQLRVTPSPPSLRESAKSKSPSVPKAATPKPTATKKAPKKSRKAQEPLQADAEPKRKKAKAVQTKESTPKARAKEKQAENQLTVPSRSPSPLPIPEPTEAPPSETATDRSRNPSASVSPKKLTALSTGGFRKKPKRNQAQTTNKAPESPAPVSAPAPRPTTVALPPHPLRSSKNGPLMSTTELSALLQKGPKSMRLEDDPIEDGTQGDPNASPSRSLKRSRSENDAPILSASMEWEHRNLPKDTTKPADDSAQTVAPKPKGAGLAALVKKTDPRRKFQRTRSWNVDTGVALAGEEEAVVMPLVSPVDDDDDDDDDDDGGPWSREAFDLFDWRPPASVGEGEEEERRIGLLVDRR